MSYYGFKEPYRIDMGKEPLSMSTEDAVFHSAVILFFTIVCLYSDYKRTGQSAGQALFKAVIVGTSLYLSAVLVLIAFLTHPFISIAVSAVIIAIITFRNVLERKRFQRQLAAEFRAKQQQLKQQNPPTEPITTQNTIEISPAELPAPQIVVEASPIEQTAPQMTAEETPVEMPVLQKTAEVSPAKQSLPASPLRPRHTSRTHRPPRRDKHR